MKKKAKDKTIMTVGEVAVLVEELRSEFRLFGDGLKELREKIEGISIALAKAMEKITAIDLRLTRLESKC